MRRTLLALAASAFALAAGTAVAQTQQGPGGPMMQQGRPGMMQQGQPDMMRPQQGAGPMSGQRSDERGPGMMDPSGGPGHRRGMIDSDRRDRYGWRPDRMGPRMMGPGMMTMMMILVDTDSDGALSLEEVQAAHARMFNYADTDKDGKLTREELQSFFHGGGFGRDDDDDDD